MENADIKQMFDRLQVFVEKNIESGNIEHKEIKEWLRKLCDRMTSQENKVDNHLVNTAKKAKSTKEKTQLLITIGSVAIAGIAIITRFF